VSRSCELQFQEEELNLEKKKKLKRELVWSWQGKENKPCCKQEQWTRHLSSTRPTILRSVKKFSYKMILLKK
jgi:hypothetical protein